MPRHFTSYAKALEYCNLTNGIIYQFGTNLNNAIYKVYHDSISQPMGAKVVYQADNLSIQTVLNWVVAL